MTTDIELITAGQMHRYYSRQVVVGDGRRPARTPLAKAQEEAGVPAGRWMGRGLPALGLAAGDVVTETQLRNLFGEKGRHPHADLIEADQLAAGKSPKAAWKAGALGRRVKVTGADFVFRPQPTIYLLWALGDDETRQVIEAAHERAIERVLEWIEDQVAVIRFGKDGVYQVRPPGGLVAARFRHHEARSGMPLLHDHLMLSVKGQRPGGKWGSVHSEVLFENTVAASSLYNEIVMAEVCEALGLASEPRTVTAGRRPVMEIAGVPHELIRWTSRRSDQIAACLADLEHEYVTAVDDDGNLKFAAEVSEQARAKLNRIAAKMTRPPKQQTRPLAQLRAWWKTSAILTSGVAADVINSLLEHARAAAAAIRARVAAVVDVALAAVDVTAMVFVMNKDGFFHRRHLLAEARRHLALVLRGRRREPGLDEEIVDAAIATHCLDISEPKTLRGHMPAYRFYTARWPLTDPPTRRRPPDAEPDPSPRPPAGPSDPDTTRLPLEPGEWDIPRVPLLYDRAVIASTVLSARLRAARRTGRALYDDVVAHQQAAMPEQLLIPFPDTDEDADSEPRSALDMAALRALKESRTDVEALDFTAERLRHLQDAFTVAADRARATMDRYADLEDTGGPHPVREDDQRAHQPHQPGSGQSPGAHR
ncbi:relaxase domain-containing protein [Streptomyces sp. NBC_01549]|uniref:MobF family relaxase n=1 Tax=Streptomyces sp. NBC_01549 TaxID=2975874 RepID=UPI0022544DEF|nr:MobF family relaxase [Streptomyces sp. NBC_01549]MCX4598830.1 relaxase domain-containing protein [Streptomyces sp. NBC_01549]